MSLLSFRITAVILLLLSTCCAWGKPVEITVHYQGSPVGEAVVYFHSNTPFEPQRKDQVMGQQEKAFVPHVIAVEKGAEVDFPNNDPINHHVYSFSPAKSFSLKLFKGDRDAQHKVKFDKPGIVTVGCNIHDWMLGYIFVVDTPYFAVTDAQGKAVLNLPEAAEGRIKIWHPRFDQINNTLSFATGSEKIEFSLPNELKPDPRPQSRYD